MKQSRFPRLVIFRLAFVVTAFYDGTLLADRSPLSGANPDPLAVLRAEEDAINSWVEKTIHAAVFIGGGSGVCISEDGVILTNDHVVANPRTGRPIKTLLVRFARTGLRRRAKLLGHFPAGDIALLKIQKEGKYPFLEFGDSDTLVPGERVIAIGNPFLLAVDNESFRGAPPSYEPSVSLGVVSAVHRNSPPRYPDAIQVDVAVNPGNSGGPLLNLDGKIVGINGKIETRFHMSVNSGVGYAIASRQIQRFLDPLKNAGGKMITRGRILGVELGERGGGSAKPGIPISRMARNSELAVAGLAVGDRIVAVDGYPIPTKHRYSGLMMMYPAESQVQIDYLHGDERRTVVTTLQRVDPESRIRLGLRLDDPEDQLKVTNVATGSPADLAGVQAGDRIVRFDNSRVTLFSELANLVEKKSVGDIVALRIERAGKAIDIPFLLRDFEEETPEKVE